MFVMAVSVAAGHRSPGVFRTEWSAVFLGWRGKSVARAEAHATVFVHAGQEWRLGQKVARAFLMRGTKVGWGCEPDFLRLKNVVLLG
jgi:hypothetical protein